MTKNQNTKHSYKNPSKKQDLSHLEAQGSKGKKYYDKDGWEISPPISDRSSKYLSSLPILFRIYIRNIFDKT